MNRSQSSDSLEQRLQLAERAIAHREVAARQAREQLATTQRANREIERGLRDELVETRSERDRVRAENVQLVDELSRARDEVNVLRERLSTCHDEFTKTMARRGIVVVDRVARAVRRQIRP